jgi:hypothetical protein
LTASATTLNELSTYTVVRAAHHRRGHLHRHSEWIRVVPGAAREENEMPRVVTTYLVLEKKRGWRGQARVVRTAANAPTLRTGQCAVKVRVEVPDEAFEPVFSAPDQVVALDYVMRPNAQAVKS